MVVLVVHLTIQAGRESEVDEMFAKLQSETRREPGCVTYIVQRSMENSRRYLVYEQYRNEAALEEHRNSPHFKQYAANGVFPLVEQRQAEFFELI